MNDTHDRTCSFRTYRVMLLVTVQRVCISQAHHGSTRMFKEAGHDVVDDRVLSRGYYWEARQEHPGGSKIIVSSSVVRLHTSKLKGHPRPPADLRVYECAASQSYQRLIMRQFNPAPYYEDSQFVFGATGAESAYTTSAEASSSAAEGGCSTPPTEYTPELETSELPYFAIDPTLLDDVHDPTSKKRKLDSLSSELEDHDANMPTFTGTHGRAGHPPTRRFQSPFLPASKKICTSNQKTSKIPIPSRLKVSTEIAAPIRSSVPSSIRSSALSSIHSSVPSSIHSSALSSIHSSVPSSIRSSAPSSIRSTAPSSIRPTAPLRSNLPGCLSTVVPRSTHPPQSIPQPSHGAITSKKQAMSEPQASLTPTCSFLVHKPIVSRSRPKPKPVVNTMQPLAFSKNTVTLSSRSKLPPVRDIPPVPQDDSDDVELNSGLLTRKSIGGSSKDKVSAHSRSQLESGRQHSMLQTMQGEILQLRKEQSRISQDHSAVTNRIDMQVEAIILRLEALEVLQKMMGIETNEALPAPVDNTNEFWADIDELTIDNEISSTKVLRPKWELSWTGNAKWHGAYVERFRRDACTYEPTLSQDTVDKLPSKTLKSLTGKVFKNMKQKYKEAEKPISVQSLNVQSARREKRHLDKAALASAVRPDFPPLAGEEYDFIFAAKWQSTDYSGSDASDDINSSDDEAVSAPQSAPKSIQEEEEDDNLNDVPTCMAVEGCDSRRAIKEIRGAVDEDVEKKEAQKKHWMKKRIPRVQGPPRMAKSLPVHDSMKTPRWAVSTKWLHSLSLEERNEQEALMTEDHVIGDSESSTDPNIDDSEQEEINYDSV
ncbi:hypothetical protein DEU56DRAFT_757805 [Suillus clintonianus]|uniref:uncharacterized protein n=1 Tax=Suillus clintonianus TaxID=1904413 RepID=UPI001B874320|nr:uncharacterized protein DEU56DRAFT_757805 [Suillus clintonianus]KAG2130734.1 hypothetical protein DEU56DRAFT_757805 [Suillus clintonianus]